MKFGITCWTNELEYLKHLLRRTVPFKPDAVELRMEFPEFHFSCFNTALIRELTSLEKDYDIRFTFHTSIQDTNIASLNPTIQEASFTSLRKEVEAIQAFAPTTLVIHGGKFWAQSLRENQEDQLKAEIFPLIRDRLIPVLEFATRNGIEILLENSPRDRKKIPLISDIHDHMKWITAFFSHGAGAVVDVGHARISHGNPEEHLKQMAPYIREVHIHNNDGIRDSHNGLHFGKIDYAAVFEKFSDNDWLWMMEIKSPAELEDSLQWIRTLQKRSA